MIFLRIHLVRFDALHFLDVIPIFRLRSQVQTCRLCQVKPSLTYSGVCLLEGFTSSSDNILAQHALPIKLSRLLIPLLAKKTLIPCKSRLFTIRDLRISSGTGHISCCLLSPNFYFCDSISQSNGSTQIFEGRIPKLRMVDFFWTLVHNGKTASMRKEFR